MEIKNILNERSNTHGDFSDNAVIMVETLRVWGVLPKESHLSDVQIAALIYDAGKTSRIVSGNPNNKDHWDDKAGYATLVSERIDVV